jgi:hypothetical protein
MRSKCWLIPVYFLAINVDTRFRQRLARAESIEQAPIASAARIAAAVAALGLALMISIYLGLYAHLIICR